LIVPDVHADPNHDNRRADYLSELIQDEQPDKVIFIGDVFDLASLSSYDKGKRAFQGRSYAKDIEAGVEFLDRVWSPLRSRKKRLPTRYFFIGNHEDRITRALDLSPELEGTIGLEDCQLERYFNEVVGYEGRTPGTLEIDGVNY